jgi:hypothetical protein
MKKYEGIRKKTFGAHSKFFLEIYLEGINWALTVVGRDNLPWLEARTFRTQFRIVTVIKTGSVTCAFKN